MSSRRAQGGGMAARARREGPGAGGINDGGREVQDTLASSTLVPLRVQEP